MFVGEIAALSAAFSFSITSICFTLVGRKVSAVATLALSLPLSWLMMLVVHQFSLGVIFPMNASVDRWFALSASGILAFVISSYFMLNAYQYTGPRLTMLVASFAPVLGALLAWIFLGQTLPANSTLGIMIVIFGIVWVVLERSNSKAKVAQPNLQRGIMFACLGTLAQGTAFVFSSVGVADGFPPFSATLIRITAGIVAIWVVIALQGNLKTTISIIMTDRRIAALLTIAAFAGPVIAGSLLLLSFQHASVGVSTTLSHTTAIMLIPISYFVFKETISLRAVIGTMIAIIGIAILFI